MRLDSGVGGITDNILRLGTTVCQIIDGRNNRRPKAPVRETLHDQKMILHSPHFPNTDIAFSDR